MYGLKFLTLAIIAGTALASCPDGYTPHHGSCYKLLDVLATWAEAITYCHAIGGKLATIEDASEQQFLIGHLGTIKATIKTSEIWIGATDMLEEGVFLEPETLRPLTYFNWGGGQPDNNNGQHCIGLFRDQQFLWDDNDCDTKFQPLCKKPQSEGSGQIVG